MERYAYAYGFVPPLSYRYMVICIESFWKNVQLSGGLPRESKNLMLSQKELLKVYAVFVTYNQNSLSEDNLAGMDFVVTDRNKCFRLSGSL